MELETEAELPFLDLKLTRRSNTIEFSIFRKPTATDHAIHSRSMHPAEHKSSSFRSLLYRLFTVPMNDTNFKKELDIIKVIAHRNGYSQQYLKILYNKMNKRITQRNITVLEYNLESKQYFTIPFVHGISDKIRQFFKSHKIRIAFRPPGNLKDLLCNLDRSQDSLSVSGVYRIECSCSAFYIGRTFRSIQTRTSEHLRLTKSTNNLLKFKSTFANHIYTEGHKISNIPKVTVLHKLYKNSQSDINNLEMLEILLSIKHEESRVLNDISDFDNIYILKNLINLGMFKYTNT